MMTQALINPYVYGLRWRRSVLLLGSGEVPDKKAGNNTASTASILIPATPATSSTTGSAESGLASAPPSPPSSGRESDAYDV
jgi:hypothetical protein